MANDQGVISVRFTPDEAQELRRRADRIGVTVSEYLRGIARDVIGAQERQEMSRMPGAVEYRTDSGAHVVIAPGRAA